MRLSELHKEQRATIVRIDADSELRKRFYSFGMVPGERIAVRGCAPAKSTIEVEVGDTLIALRKEEAEKIVVEGEEPNLVKSDG